MFVVQLQKCSSEGLITFIFFVFGWAPTYLAIATARSSVAQCQWATDPSNSNEKVNVKAADTQQFNHC